MDLEQRVERPPPGASPYAWTIRAVATWVTGRSESLLTSPLSGRFYAHTSS